MQPPLEPADHLAALWLAPHKVLVAAGGVAWTVILRAKEAVEDPWIPLNIADF